MTVEAIAQVISDLRRGNVINPLDGPGPEQVFGTEDTVVDVTEIYNSLRTLEGEHNPYDDHPCIAPPWNTAAFCYENVHRNVIAMVAFVYNDIEWEAMADTHSIDWDAVKWRLHVLYYVGGYSAEAGGKIPTVGPCHLDQIAIGEHGEPLDIHWVNLSPKHPVGIWELGGLTMLGALNFLNCTNVEAVVPARPRAERRRLERIGVNVHTLNVFPTRRRDPRAGLSESLGMPLTSVRGHFAHYGPEYDKGLLFGRHAGKFWIPQHAIGSEAHGIDQHDYLLKVEN